MIPPIKALDIEHSGMELGCMDLSHVYTLHGIEDAGRFDGLLKKNGKESGYRGGGLIGMEMTEPGEKWVIGYSHRNATRNSPHS